MEGAALRSRAATVVLQGLLVMIFISAMSALKCHSSNILNHFTPHKGNTTMDVSTRGGIVNCSSAENVCSDLQLKLTIDKEVLIMSHRGCTNRDLKDRPKSIATGDRHFAIQFDESYCQSDLCNKKTKMTKVSKTPIGDKAAEASGSNQCYTGFAWGPGETVQQTMTCGQGYNRCYYGNKSITVGGLLYVAIIFRTCQRPACDVLENQSFGPINITTDSEFCCSGSNCNAKVVGFPYKGINAITPVDIAYGVRSTANPNLSYDQYEDEDDNLVYPELPVPPNAPTSFGSDVQGLSLQLCPLMAALGATALGIW